MSKVNCPDCLSGNHKKCTVDDCLCRESHKDLCKQCEKKPASKGILFTDFCSPECATHWVLTSPDALKEEYSSDTKVTCINSYLKKHKSYRDIVYSLRGNPGMTFNFNVLESPILSQWFNEDAENFPNIVKAAILKTATDYGIEQRLVTIINREINVIITDATSIKLHEWGAEHEGIPLQVECQVIAAGMPETYTKHAEAYCPDCNDRKEIRSLGIIPKCRTKDCDRKNMKMIIDQSTVKTGDVRSYRIQEPIEQAKHGTPTSFPCIIKDEFMHSTFVGQRKKIIGVFRSLPQIGKDTNTIVINAVSVTDMDDDKDIEPDTETVKFFQSLSKKKDYLDILINSISPELKHEDLAKLNVLIACVGGTASGRLRGDIHGILVGSPSAGKSTLLSFIPMFNQKSSFVNGSTMSGTSVTASMDTLPNREKIVRAGAMSLCTGGILACDEMNQLTPEDLGKMFEGMETGKIHYNKGGYDVTLDARTAIMGGANPKGYEYNFDITMMDNLSFMPPPMVSRFDLITLMTSQKSEAEEEDIERHILRIRKKGVEAYVEENNLLKPQQLLLFINHVKKIIPEILPETEEALLAFSSSMRKVQVLQKGMKRADKRFFESMIRISSAIAKIHLSKKVEKKHAEMAIHIYTQNLNSFNIDTSEGVVVHKQEQFVTGKKSAFETGLHRLQAKSKDGRFAETEALEFITEHYPQYFTHTDATQKMFDEYYNKGKLGKSGGRYRLE